MTKKILFGTVLAITTFISTVTHADGLLSKLLGGSKGGADFKSLMAHVPADTPYLFANKEPIPDKVMDFHLKRGEEMMAMLAKASTTEKAADSKDIEAFFNAILQDYAAKLADGKFEETGLSKKARMMVYGVDMLPVIRLAYSDKEKLMAMIKRAEEKSEFKTELTKCGELDCFTGSDKKGEFNFALVLLKDHLAASFFPAENKKAMSNHLIGKDDPKETFGTEKWDEFLKENDYKGFGDGFIKLGKIYKNASPLIALGMMGKVDPKEIEGCQAVIEEHVSNMSEVIFGTKDLQAKKMDYELLFKTSAVVSDVFQGIANDTNIAKRSENAIIDFGININFIKLRDALIQYSNFLIKAGKTHKCTAIDEQKIRKSMGGMAMVMNMGMTQLKSIYASVSNVDLGDKMEPENIDALISIGTADPAGLVAMVSMMNPKMMGFQVPADGSSVELPEGSIPSKGRPVPPLFLSRSENALNIMVGNDKPTLVDYKNETSQISFSSMDGKRYMEKFTSIMKAMPGQDKDKDDLKILESAAGISGKVFQEMSADKRGLVINYNVQY